MSNFLKLPYAGGNSREVAQVVNNILDGKVNSTGSFTCTTSATSTVVTDFRAGKQSIILLMPTTANAASEVSNGTIFISARNKQSFTVTHSNNSQADRSYGYAILG